MDENEFNAVVHNDTSNQAQISADHQKITLEIGSHFDIGFLISYFIVLILVQNIYFSYVEKNDRHNNLNDEIDFNLKNNDSIEELIKNELQSKLNLLKTAQNQTGMPYQDWVDLINKDPFIYYPTKKDVKFWIESWKVIPNTNNENFQLRIYPNQDFLYHSWKDLINTQHQKFISKHIEIDNELIWVDSSDSATNTLAVPPYGRGYRGTGAATHEIGRAHV